MILYFCFLKATIASCFHSNSENIFFQESVRASPARVIQSSLSFRSDPSPERIFVRNISEERPLYVGDSERNIFTRSNSSPPPPRSISPPIPRQSPRHRSSTAKRSLSSPPLPSAESPELTG